MKETIVKKAWSISAKDLIEPWHHDDIVVFADTRGEARSKGLDELRYQGATKDVSYLEDNEIYYTDIGATRYKESDKIQFEDKVVSRSQVKNYLWQKERDENARQLTITHPNDLAVVYAGCYGQYWGANHSGYSSAITFAGKYSTKEAYDIVKGSDYGRQETVRLLDVVQFNAQLDVQILVKETEIERLKTYKI